MSRKWVVVSNDKHVGVVQLYNERKLGGIAKHTWFQKCWFHQPKWESDLKKQNIFSVMVRKFLPFALSIYHHLPMVCEHRPSSQVFPGDPVIQTEEFLWLWFNYHLDRCGSMLDMPLLELFFQPISEPVGHAQIIFCPLLLDLVVGWYGFHVGWYTRHHFV